MHDDFILIEGPRPVSYDLPPFDVTGQGTPQRFEAAFHAFIGARIPYLPTLENLQTAQQPDFLARELFRRFVVLTEVVAGLQPNNAITLRIFNQPHLSTRYPRLDLWLVAKSAQPTEEAARQEVSNLWGIVQHAFPTEFPFGYPLLPANRTAIRYQHRAMSLNRVQQVVQFVKWLDRGPSGTEADAFPHPYRSAPSLHALLPLFSALESSPERLGLIVSLQPSGLWDRAEAVQLLEEFSTARADSVERMRQQLEVTQQQGQRFEGADDIRMNVLKRQILQASAMREDERLRARLGAQILDNLLRSQNRLLDMRVSLIGWGELQPASAIQAVRAALSGHLLTLDDDAPLYCNPPEIMTHVQAKYDDQLTRIVDDLIWMEPARASDLRTQWRTLVTPEEAAALFCLPMPPEFGQVPGILSKSQPFFLPVEAPPVSSPIDSPHDKISLRLGPILDRGTSTEHWAHIPLDKLDQHILIAGRSGSGKTNTCLLLLRELARHGIPFLVLDPLDKSDYRLLLADGLLDDEIAELPRLRDSRPLNETLRIYTLGSAASPFTFNPFRVPRGVTVQKHISQLQRCFLTAFVVSDPIPAIYRAALRDVYTRSGWRMDDDDTGGHGERMPTFAEFLRVLEEVVTRRSAEYSAEIRGNIRQMTLLRMGSLLEDNSRILNVRPNDQRDPLDDIVQYPTVLELGHIGSDEDKALIMAFLLTCLMPHIQKRSGRTLHVTLIEEAHRLMRRGGSGSNDLRGDATGQTRSDFSNLLAEVRGYNQGIIVADQSPSELVAAVFANTATHIMHQLRDPQSFEMMTSTFVLNSAQATYARHLEVGHAITETVQGAPIHVHPPNVSDALKQKLKGACFDGIPYFEDRDSSRVVSDDTIEKIMASRCAAMPKPEVISDYEQLLPTGLAQTAAKSSETTALVQAIKGLLPKGARWPLCAGCIPLWRTGDCLHHQRIVEFRKPSAERSTLERPILKTVEAPSKQQTSWDVINRLGPKIAAAAGASPDQEADVVYCELVHLAFAIELHKDPERKKNAPKYIALLREFHYSYHPDDELSGS